MLARVFAFKPAVNVEFQVPAVIVPTFEIAFVTEVGSVPVTFAACSDYSPLPLPVMRPELRVIVPLPNTALAVALPTVNPVSVPTEVILG